MCRIPWHRWFAVDRSGENLIELKALCVGGGRSPHPSRKSCNAIILSRLFSRAAEDADEEDGSLSLPPNSSLIKKTVRCCQIKSALLSVLLSPNVQGMNEAGQLKSVPY